jgi:hypothetical protein
MIVIAEKRYADRIVYYQTMSGRIFEGIFFQHSILDSYIDTAFGPSKQVTNSYKP